MDHSLFTSLPLSHNHYESWEFHENPIFAPCFWKMIHPETHNLHYIHSKYIIKNKSKGLVFRLPKFSFFLEILVILNPQ